MKVGTTGSRHGRPYATAQRFRRLLLEWEATELHHGDCVGWDEQAHLVAVSLGLRTVAHPPDDDSLRAFCSADVVLPPADYISRNHAIVDAVDRLVAAPDGPERLRSGTWATVRYAKKIGRRGIILAA